MTSPVPAPSGDFDPAVARELAELAELAQALQTQAGRQRTLQSVCDLAVRAIDADHASITIRGRGGLRTVAASSLDDDESDHAGARSTLSTRLFSRDGEVGFLNVFADRPDAFGEPETAVFSIFAAHAAVALQAAEEQERADNLEIALRTSRRIGTAIGILMHRERVDETVAFEMLRRRSQDTNRKVSAIAEEVVRTGVL